MSATHYGYALAAGALVLFAASIFLTRIATARVDLSTGVLVALAVNVLVGAIVFGVDVVLRGAAFVPQTSALLLFFAAGVFTSFLGRWFFYSAVVRLGPARASTFHVTSPLFTAALGWMLAGERLAVGTVAAMAFTTLGLWLVGASRRTPPSTHGAASAPPVRAWLSPGAALGLGSAVGYAIGNVLRGIAIDRWHEPLAGALAGAVAGLALQLVAMAWSGGALAKLRVADRRGLACYAGTGVATILAQTLTIAAMAYAPVAIVALITLCTPLLVYPASWLLLRNEEGITGRTVAGALLALAGIVAIVMR